VCPCITLAGWVLPRKNRKGGRRQEAGGKRQGGDQPATVPAKKSSQPEAILTFVQGPHLAKRRDQISGEELKGIREGVVARRRSLKTGVVGGGGGGEGEGC